MNEIMLSWLLCALGALCYGFYFKCVDWFRKDLTPYVYKSPYLEHPRIRLSDVRARQTRKILNR